MQSNRPTAIILPAHSAQQQADRVFRASGQTFEVHAAADGTTIDLYDEIGRHGVSAKDMRDRLRGVSGDVVVRINSPGGDVFDGIAILNDLLAHDGKVRVEIVGVAASAASIVAMAGDEIAIADGAFLMIHNSWALTVGNREDHNETSELLEQIDHSLATTYAKRSGGDIRAIARMMTDETWFDANAAKQQGFATEILDVQPPRAKFDLTVYAKAPSLFRDEIAASRLDARTISNTRDAEKFLRDAGFPRSRAKAMASGFRTVDDQREADAEYELLAAHIAAKTFSISF